jgi:hypothetical protein
MYLVSRAWKGDITIHIQSVMNNKQSIKLKVLKLYAPSASVVSRFPTMFSAINAPSDLIEFSQGNQVADISLPYLARNALTYNTRDYQVSMPFGVGMYYIYLAQPMVIGDSSPTVAEFNVYISCNENFSFYGYSTEVGRPLRIFTPNVPPSTASKNNVVFSGTEDKEIRKKGQSATVMNQPSDPAQLMRHTQDQVDIDDSRLVPLVDIRPLIRRFQYSRSGTVIIDATTGNTRLTIPIYVYR